MSEFVNSNLFYILYYFISNRVQRSFVMNITNVQFHYHPADGAKAFTTFRNTKLFSLGVLRNLSPRKHENMIPFGISYFKEKLFQY